MAVITGIGGTITLAGATTTDVKSWAVEIIGGAQVKKVLSASGNWVTAFPCIQINSRGAYTADVDASCQMDVTGLVQANIHGWTVTTESEANPYAVIGEQWTYNTPGYRSGGWEIRCTVDATDDPPVAGDIIATLVLLADTGISYSGAAQILGVSVENGEGARECVISGIFTSAITAAGNLPLAGIAGALSAGFASPVAAGGVLTTSTTVTVERGVNMPSGSQSVKFVGNGEITIT